MLRRAAGPGGWTTVPADSQVVLAQDRAHPAGHDYDKGSPHLRHPQLRSMVQGRLEALVAEAIARTGRCRVLEIGAGHGTFTETLLAAGATVTVTETSRASAQHLRAVFAGDRRVRVLYDATGEELFELGETFDLAAIISVLHHIPDYLAFLHRLGDRIEPDGAIFSVQDPLFYPRRSLPAHVASRGSYFLWRLGQGEVRRGLRTRLRRLRGVWSETEESDLVEYHVVRQGCDEEAIREALDPAFEVAIFRYWSTQSPLLQRLGERTRLRSDFGVVARRRCQNTDTRIE